MLERNGLRASLDGLVSSGLSGEEIVKPRPVGSKGVDHAKLMVMMKMMVMMVVVVVLVSWGIYIATSIEHQAKNFPGYIEVGIVEGDYDPANETGIVRYYP